MFILHTSLSIDGVITHYEKKSFLGLLETVNPHIFGMGIIFFILTHFLAVIKGVKNKYSFVLFVTLFSMVILSNVSGFFISYGEGFSMLKLLSTLLLIIISFILIVRLGHTFQGS